MLDFAQRVDTMKDSAKVMYDLFHAVTDPRTINFASGSPANETLPVDEVREIAMEVLQKDGRGFEALQYNNPTGILDLRKIVAEYLLPRRGIEGASPDEVLISTGGLEPLYYACQLFINPGDTLLVESPTFMHAVEMFKMFEANCVEVECDDEGMIIEDLKAKQEKYNARMVYIIPTFQNPTGKTMSLERRKAVAELANEKNFIILEDDPYVELRYSGEDLPAIKTFDTTDNVVYANSFSKIFSPGNRLGYIYAAKPIVDKAFDIKTATNSHTAVLPQILCAEYFMRGYYPDHIADARAFYLDKRDHALEYVKKYMPEGTKVNTPDGGLFMWLQIPSDKIDTRELLEAAKEKLVAFVAGPGFYIDEGKGLNELRMSYGHLSYEQLEKGISTLAELIKERI